MKQKRLRKLVSMILAVAMVLAMSATAFADDPEYSITISNTTTGEDYYAYQIFKATYVSNYTQGNETGIAYTIESTSAWYQAVIESELFDLAETSTSGTYVVTKKSTTDATAISSWAKTAEKDESYGITSSAGEEGNGTGGSLTLNVSTTGAGYYYVSSSLGTTVTLTSAAPAATVIDKNQKPGGNLEKTVSDTKAEIGDTVDYTITSNVPAYDGDTEIEDYTFKDTLSEGLTAPNSENVKVEILKPNSSGSIEITIDETACYYEIFKTLTNAVSVNGQEITVSYDPSSIENYPADAYIMISYTATVNAEAAYENGNSVTQTWTDEANGMTVEENVYTYGFKLIKVIKDTETELNGAKFKLYNSENGTTPMTFTYDLTTETYTVDPNGSIGEIEAGSAYIFGLDADVTYYLEETQAPVGYNALTERQSVTISTTGTTEQEETVDGVTTKVLSITQTVGVENGAGSTLPSTGGIGTTIFYIVGGVLVLGAAVLFVTKKRLGSEN